MTYNYWLTERGIPVTETYGTTTSNCGEVVWYAMEEIMEEVNPYARTDREIPKILWGGVSPEEGR